MPGFEVFGDEERQAINDLFDANGGVLFAHAFDAVRNGIYKVREYEKAFAAKVGARHGQAVSTGTAAIQVGLQAMGIGPGDEVITQSFTFVATVEAIQATGATPIIVDVDESLNMAPAALENAITPRTRAVLPVHMMGEPARMSEILAIAKKHGLKILEDSAQGLGCTYKGKSVGTLGDVGAYSTDAGKTLTTGEGGMVVTNDEEIYTLARARHDHGHEYSKTKGRGEEGALCPGYNFRMNELQGVMGLVQLAKLDMIVAAHKANKKRMMAGLKEMDVAFRDSPDPEGDLSDAIIFFLPTAEVASAFVAEMRAQSLGTKNLPDAIQWHFSRNWGHLFDGDSPYRDSFRTEWSASAGLLARAVALPVMVKMEESAIDETVTKLLAVAAKTL